MRRLTLVAVLILGLAGAAWGTTYYANANSADDGGTGASPDSTGATRAKKTIAAALDLCTGTDQLHSVQVVPGTYSQEVDYKLRPTNMTGGTVSVTKYTGTADGVTVSGAVTVNVPATATFFIYNDKTTTMNFSDIAFVDTHETGVVAKGYYSTTAANLSMTRCSMTMKKASSFLVYAKPTTHATGRTITLTDCTFTQSNSTNGYGCYVEDGNLTVTRGTYRSAKYQCFDLQGEIGTAKLLGTTASAKGGTSIYAFDVLSCDFLYVGKDPDSPYARTVLGESATYPTVQGVYAPKKVTKLGIEGVTITTTGATSPAIFVGYDNVRVAGYDPANPIAGLSIRDVDISTSNSTGHAMEIGVGVSRTYLDDVNIVGPTFNYGFVLKGSNITMNRCTAYSQAPIIMSDQGNNAIDHCTFVSTGSSNTAGPAGQLNDNPNGTATVSAIDTVNITVSAASFFAGQEGSWIVFDATSEPYRIATVTDSTHVILETSAAAESNGDIHIWTPSYNNVIQNCIFDASQTPAEDTVTPNAFYLYGRGTTDHFNTLIDYCYYKGGTKTGTDPVRIWSTGYDAIADLRAAWEGWDSSSGKAWTNDKHSVIATTDSHLKFISYNPTDANFLKLDSSCSAYRGGSDGGAVGAHGTIGTVGASGTNGIFGPKR